MRRGGAGAAEGGERGGRGGAGPRAGGGAAGGGRPPGRHRRRAGAGDLPSVARRDAAPAGRCPGGTQARRATVISHLAGTVCAISPEGAVIEVGGVGLLVQCTPGTLATLRAGEQAR